MEVKMKKFLSIVCGFTFCIATIGPCEPLAYSKGGGFSSGGRSSSFSSGSRSSGFSSGGSKSSGWGSSSKSTSSSGWGTSSKSSSGWGTSKSNGSGSSWWNGSSSKSSGFSSSKSKTTADSLSYQRAKDNGTAFTSKTAAVNNFKTKYADKYPSTFKTEPKTRPNYIPQSTNVGGKSYNVTYNNQYGGYGYMGPGNSWVSYNPMMDALVLSSLMNSHNYYVGTPPSAVVYTNSNPIAKILLALLIFAAVGFIIYIIVRSV